MSASHQDGAAPGSGRPTVAGESAALVEVLMAGFTRGAHGGHADQVEHGDQADHVDHADHADEGGDDAGIGCTCGGRGAAGDCPGCAVCHLSRMWHGLDPRILDSVADVTDLIGDGLRRVARRLAEDGADHSHRGRTTPS